MSIITLTKHAPNHSSSDVQAPACAGAPVVTDEMVKAGISTLVDEWGVVGNDLAPALARDVFLAMWVRKDLK